MVKFALIIFYYALSKLSFALNTTVNIGVCELLFSNGTNLGSLNFTQYDANGIVLLRGILYNPIIGKLTIYENKSEAGQCESLGKRTVINEYTVDLGVINTVTSNSTYTHADGSITFYGESNILGKSCAVQLDDNSIIACGTIHKATTSAYLINAKMLILFLLVIFCLV